MFAKLHRDTLSFFFSVDISLYKGEDQLDEIERKRKGEEKKVEKKVVRKEVKQRVEKEVKDEIDFKPEVKKRGRAKVDQLTEKVKPAEPRKGRRAASNISYDHDSYDFLEEDDDEVMPAPKKRKSQDSLDTPPDEGSKVEGEKESQQPRVQTENKKEEKVETPPEELSTSEKAALAEKAKMESEEKEKEEDSANATSEAQQHAKKRGRKPKP